MENKIISKSLRRKLFLTRCIVFIMLFIMALPMLCSFAPSPALAASVSTEPITNVWTGIMNWLTSSLNTVQGLFVQQSGGTAILEAGSYTFNETLIDFPTEQNKVFFGYEVPDDEGVNLRLGIANYYHHPVAGNADDLISGVVFGSYVSDLDFLSPVYIDPPIYADSNWNISKATADSVFGTIELDSSVDSVFAEWYIKNTNYLEYHDAPVIDGGYELTLLGTLAVIGVSIALCFLIIGVFKRFLKLRG